MLQIVGGVPRACGDEPHIVTEMSRGKEVFPAPAGMNRPL